MKNTIGNEITLTVFGESHGEAVGGVLDGLPPGMKIDYDEIKMMMGRRHGDSRISTARREADIPRFLSGIKDGYTEGTPLAFIIPNENVRRSDYDALRDTPRPSHADLAAELKYLGFQDASGGGHFSGRLTAVYTAAGAVLRSALRQKNILIATHISFLHGIRDRSFSLFPEEEIRQLEESGSLALDKEAGEKMVSEILQAKEENDSLGGILETAVTGLPGGLGEPLFESLESRLAQYMYSIPAVKGIEFGAGFEFAYMYGSEANDAFAVKDGKIVTLTNHSGGINGGITNGMPVVFRTVYRPTPSIGKAQQTVNLKTMKEEMIEITGRHDPAVVQRAIAVQDAVTALCLADILTQAYGRLYLKGEDA